MLRLFDEIAENDRQFLVNLQHQLRSNLFIQDWIEIVWIQFIDQTFEWINNEKKIMIMIEQKSSDKIDKTNFVQLICEKYFAVNEFVVKKSVVIKQSVAIKLIDIQQSQNEIIVKYYQRIHDILVAIDDMNTIIKNWIDDFNNKKLTRHLTIRFIRKQNLFDVCNIAERKLRQKIKRKQKKKNQLILQQQFQNIVDREIARIQIFYEFLHFLKQIRSEVLKICTVANITNIEIFEKSIASKYVKWIIVFTSLQKSSFEICFVVNEFLSILKQMSCNLSKINVVVNNFDIESIDEIFAFEFDKWIVVIAEKKIFDYINTFDETSKNSFAFDIESVSNISFDWNRCYIVDMKILNQKIFALTVTYDAFSKNSFALFFENLKISIAMNMSSLKHLMNMNDFTIETFDFDIAMNASLKNSSSQHIENSKTLKKNSICIYEFSAFSVFDLSIDIDFEIYTIDIETFSFGWSRCCTNSIDFRNSISICISASTVTSIDAVNIEFCEKEQFCFINFSVSISVDVISTNENIDFYEKKQSFCFRDYIISIAVDFVVNIDVNILIADLINTTKNFVWMSLLNSIDYLTSKPKLLETIPEMSRDSSDRTSAAARRACKYLLAHILLDSQSINIYSITNSSTIVVTIDNIIYSMTFFRLVTV